MKKIFAVALGVLTAIGGFVDIGDLVANGLVGARFGLSLAWATILGVVGICVFALTLVGFVVFAVWSVGRMRGRIVVRFPTPAERSRR